MTHDRYASSHEKPQYQAGHSPTSSLLPGKRTLVEASTTSAHAISAAATEIHFDGAHAEAAWKGGPTSKRKRRTVDFSIYLNWLKEVDGVFGKDDAISRLHRLYYGKYPDAVKEFDKVINTNNDDPQMTTAQISLHTLNGLYSTDNIRTPNGMVVDPSHIFAQLDLTISGEYYKFHDINDHWDNISVNGFVTWTGDLGSWFLEWNERRIKAEHHEHRNLSPAQQRELLITLCDVKAGKDDILGDIDAQVLAQHFTAHYPHEYPGINPHATKGISEIFLIMYGQSMIHTPHPEP